MRSPSLLTLTLRIPSFANVESDDSKNLLKIKPNDVTRVAFDKNGYDMVLVSNQTGPTRDGKLDVIDAIKLDADQVDVQDADCALILRVESTRGMDSYAAQQIGEAIEAYMTRNGATEFATAAIADIAPGQELHGKWNTLLLVRDRDGSWRFKNLRFTSIQRSTDDTYALMRDGRLTKVDGDSFVSTLLDNEKLSAYMDVGHRLGGSKKKHLVRAPINFGGAYAVVDKNGQTIYDNQFKVVVTGKTSFVVMPAINEDGSYACGQVTTVSGKGNQWDVRNRIPARKADDLAPAYGTPA